MQVLKKSTERRAILGLLSVAMIWGTGFIATQIAINEGISSTLLMAMRFFVAAVLMGSLSVGQAAKTPLRQQLAGVVAGLFLFGGFMLQTVGLAYSSTPSVNAFLTAANVVIVPFIVWIVHQKRPPAVVFAAAVVCLLGVSVLSVQPGDRFVLAMGDLITLGGAVFFALHTVVLGKVANRLPSRLLTALQLATAAVLSVLVHIAAGGGWPSGISAKGMLAVLYLAVASSSVAYFIQSICQKYVSSSKTSLIIATESLFATLLSIVLGFEMFSGRVLLGGALVTGALVLAEVDWSSLKHNRGSVK